MTSETQLPRPEGYSGEEEPTEHVPAAVAAARWMHWRTGGVLYSATDVPVEAVQWLWKDHFALGRLSLVVGPADVGKSLLVAGDFASRVSVGAAWPDGAPCPAGDVAIVSCAQSAADTLIPRLVSHGADPRRVHFVDAVMAYRDEAQDWPMAIPGVVPALGEALRRQGMKVTKMRYWPENRVTDCPKRGLILDPSLRTHVH